MLFDANFLIAYQRGAKDLLWWDASRVIRDLVLQGKKIGLADSIIAATALNYGLPLVTHNTKHLSRNCHG